jgi:4-cresol dehydrogenase (hydroxylating)
MTASTVLAAGLSEAHFSQAIGRFVAALGPDAVLTSDEALRSVRDPYTFSGWDDHVASAVLQPSSVEEIQAILRVANELRVPLWTTSQGRNNGYGGSGPRVRGAVVVNLRRMNRVLEVNEENAFAVVEPGVSFFDLYDAVQEGGYKLQISCPDLGWGSVIGNTLEHGFGYTVYGDHADAQCGMEVVLANGDVVRTGMGAMANSKSWHVYKYGFGPTLDGLFTQSNFGIVTKMGVWLMPQPERYRASWIRVKNDSDLGPLIEAVRPLMLDGTIHNLPGIGHVIGEAAMRLKRSEVWDGDGPVPFERYEEIAERLGIGMWNMRTAQYGHEHIVEAQYKLLEKAISTIPGAWIESRTYAGSAARDEVHPADRVQGGIPILDMLDMVKWYGGDDGGHLVFSPVVPLTGHHVMKLDRLVRPSIRDSGLDCLLGMTLMRRSLAYICLVPFDTTNEEQTRAAFDLYRLLVKKAAADGYGEYRAHVALMDHIAARFDFNDHAFRRLTETIKDALDPNGILSPGKQGIWPAGRRDGRQEHDSDGLVR